MTATDCILILYYKDGSYAHIAPEYEAAVEAALAKLVGESRQPWEEDDREERDSLLRLRAIDGTKVVIIASSLLGYSMGRKVAPGQPVAAKGEPRADVAGADAQATGE